MSKARNDNTPAETTADRTGGMARSELSLIQLQRQAARGSFLSLLNQSLKLLANITMPLVLGMYLGPEAFGLIAVASSIQAVMMILRDGGFANALIQKRDASDEHMSSVLWVSVGLGVMLAVTLTVMAGPIARLYGRPDLVPILRVFAVPVLAQGIGAVHEARLRKTLRFGRLLVADAGSVWLASAGAIAAVLLGCGVWSLVFRIVAVPLLLTPACWALCSWRPRRVISKTALRSLWGFGSYMLLTALFGYGITRLDGPIIGWLLGVSAAGTFFMARGLALAPLDELVGAAARVMFPVFSALQDDVATIRAGYMTGTRSLAAIIFPMVAGIITIGPDAIGVILGEAWEGVAPLIPIFAAQGIVSVVNYPAGQILFARGRSRLQLVLTALRGTAVIVSFVVGCRWGVLGAAVGWTIVRFTVAPMALLFASREVGFGIRDVLLNVLRPAIAAAGAGLAVVAARWCWQAAEWDMGWPLLAMEVASGLTCYAVLCRLLLADIVRKLLSETHKNMRWRTK